jgi:FtsP/CotA-like multicopper oxidase with cupredoxin domain
MRIATVFVAAVVPLLALAGCSDPGSDGDVEPQHHEFDIYVGATNATVALYTAGDNSSVNVFAVPFTDDPGSPSRVPGPEIRVKEGDSVTIRLHNLHTLDHTIHLHGDPGKVEWASDGVDFMTQFPVEAGQVFEYHFEDLKAGTYWYHCHVDGAHHIDFGMYGAFIVEEREPEQPYDRDFVVMLDEWDNCHVHGNTEPVTDPNDMGPDVSAQSDCYYRFMLDWLAQNQAFIQVGQNVNNTGQNDAACAQAEGLPEDTPQQRQAKQLLLTAMGCSAHAHGQPPYQQERQWWYETHPVYNPVYNTFLVNGKAFPDTPVFPVKEGERVLFRIINAGNYVHTWHPHGHTMEVIAKDSYPLAAPILMDTLAIAPGERYDYIMEMDNPGIWMIHDQMGQFTVNDNVHPGGMMACMAYDGFDAGTDEPGIAAFAMQRSLECNHEAVRLLEAGGASHGH